MDRVERAYLTHLLGLPDPLFALVRSSLGYVLLDKEGTGRIARRLAGETPWGPADLIGAMSRKSSPARRRAMADVRRLALARCRTGRLAGMLRRHVPVGCAYLNVGHSNLRTEVMAAWKTMPDAQISVLVHDTIPLDYPQFQRVGTPALFREKLRRVAAFADLAIYNSQGSRADAERWFADLGRCPPGTVAHLGVDVPPVDSRHLPQDLDLSRPYFVCLGTIEPRKNHTLLLDIWEEFASEMPAEQIPNLIIAGARGWANEAVFARLDTSPVMQVSVFERPGLDDRAVAALLSGSCGLLCPSVAEGFGLPVAEAAALGVPVICPKLPVYEEILGNIPVYADSGDVYLWKQSIRRLAVEKQAEHDRKRGPAPRTEIPTWAEHFNLVLKVT